VLLSPLSSENGSCESQNGIHQVARSREALLTLEELLACVFLEESFMGDRAGKVVDHQFEYGLDRLFGIASIVSQGWVLLSVSYLLKLGVLVKLTHSPLSRILRARYIEAAAT
jgi:hypothetical protein